MSDIAAREGTLQPLLRHALLPVVTANALLGIPVYFMAFLFAYGFEDHITVGNHVTFLVLVTAFALLASLPKAPELREIRVLVSLALNATAVGAGSIVSARQKAEYSVSRGFSHQTDVLVAGGLFAAAVACAGIALVLVVRSRDQRVVRR